MSEDAGVLRLVVIDDEPDDVLLLRRQLKKDGIDAEMVAVERLEELEAALAGPCDLLLTDYRLTGSTALDALAIAARLRPGLPVIVVSGVIDEEEAGAAFRAGARDFVTKRRLERLVPAMRRELAAAAERRHAAELERTLAASESQLEAVLSRIPSMTWAVDAELRYTSAGGTLLDELFPGWERLIGTLLEHAPGIPDEVLLAHRVTVAEARGSSFEFLAPGRIISCRIEPVLGPAGEVQGVVGFGLDVAGERRHERRAVELSTAVESLADAVLVVDEQGRILSANPAAGRLLARSGEPLVDAPLLELLRGSSAPAVQGGLRAALAGERVTGLEAVVDREDGGVAELELSLSGITQHGLVVAAAVVARDIGRRKALEAELRHAQKMEAVGRLAGGVAHDLNNVLLAVRGYASLLEEDLAGTPSAPDVAAVADAAARGASLVARLLAFARRQALRRELVDLDGAIERLAPLLRGAAGNGVEVVLHVAGDLPPVEIDPPQLDQVLLNLVINARDAMGGNGRVVVSVAPVPGLPGEAAASGVEIVVADSGPGIPPDLVPLVFEAFFTTKGDAGAGLGLSIVAGIVAEAGGSIELVPPGAPGRMIGGAVFRIVLPGADTLRAESARPAAGPLVQAGEPGSGRVLVVDDDEPARAIVARLLHRLGYDPLPVPDAGAALAVLEAGEPLFALVADLSAAGLHSTGLLEAAARRPDVLLVALSGDAASGAADLLPERALCLSKPFGQVELAQALAGA